VAKILENRRLQKLSKRRRYLEENRKPVAATKQTTPQ
jgi:hypothetical protein